MDTSSTSMMSAEKDTSHVTTSNKSVLRGVSDGQEFSQSDALSFSSFRRGTVDPRTGSFNYAIPVARITGNRRRGPSLDLVLKHNHFSSRNEGFGGGQQNQSVHNSSFVSAPAGMVPARKRPLSIVSQQTGRSLGAWYSPATQ